MSITSLRLIGAAPLPVEVDTVLRERFGVGTFSGAYGVTEASLVSWQPPGTVNRPNAAGVVNDQYFDPEKGAIAKIEDKAGVSTAK